MDKAKRVVVTGIGVISPLGNDSETTWSRLKNGESGVDFIKSFDAGEFACQIAAEVKDFNAEEWINPREARIMDNFLHFAIAAAKMALNDSCLTTVPGIGEETGCCIGTASGGARLLLEQQDVLRKSGPRKVSALTVPFSICDMGSGYVSIANNLRGPNHCVVSACASGASAIGEAARMIGRGEVKAMVAGGADGLVPLQVAAFAAAKALSLENIAPQKASRPFDAARNGFVLGEGAAVMVLEEREHAISRGAQIYGELAGYGSCSDAYHITSPDPSGIGGMTAMRKAIKEAGIAPHNVGYINAHATSTPLGDKIEVKAMQEVFGKDLEKIPVSSTKSSVGHLCGAAGAIEAIFCLLAMRDSVLPPTINFENPDPECDIDCVPNQAREKEVEFSLSNSFGFGGHNVSLLFKKS